MSSAMEFLARLGDDVTVRDDSVLGRLVHRFLTQRLLAAFDTDSAQVVVAALRSQLQGAGLLDRLGKTPSDVTIVAAWLKAVLVTRQLTIAAPLAQMWDEFTSGQDLSSRVMTASGLAERKATAATPGGDVDIDEPDVDVTVPSGKELWTSFGQQQPPSSAAPGGSRKELSVRRKELTLRDEDEPRLSVSEPVTEAEAEEETEEEAREREELEEAEPLLHVLRLVVEQLQEEKKRGSKQEQGGFETLAREAARVDLPESKSLKTTTTQLSPELLEHNRRVYQQHIRPLLLKLTAEQGIKEDWPRSKTQTQPDVEDEDDQLTEEDIEFWRTTVRGPILEAGLKAGIISRQEFEEAGGVSGGKETEVESKGGRALSDREFEEQQRHNLQTYVRPAMYLAGIVSGVLNEEQLAEARALKVTTARTLREVQTPSEMQAAQRKLDDLIRQVRGGGGGTEEPRKSDVAIKRERKRELFLDERKQAASRITPLASTIPARALASTIPARALTSTVPARGLTAPTPTGSKSMLGKQPAGTIGELINAFALTLPRQAGIIETVELVGGVAEISVRAHPSPSPAALVNWSRYLTNAYAARRQLHDLPVLSFSVRHA